MLILILTFLYVYTLYWGLCFSLPHSPLTAVSSPPRGAFLRHRNFPARAYFVTISFACVCVNVRARECSENFILRDTVGDAIGDTALCLAQAVVVASWALPRYCSLFPVSMAVGELRKREA